jgi:hypothetical protein
MCWMCMTCIEFTVIPVALCWCVLNCSCQCVCERFVCHLNSELIIDWKMLGELMVPLTLISTAASLCSWIRCFIVTHFYSIVLTFCDWFWWNGGWDHLTCEFASPPSYCHTRHSLLSQGLSLREVICFLSIWHLCGQSFDYCMLWKIVFYYKEMYIFMLVFIYAADTV